MTPHLLLFCIFASSKTWVCHNSDGFDLTPGCKEATNPSTYPTLIKGEEGTFFWSTKNLFHGFKFCWTSPPPAVKPEEVLFIYSLDLFTHLSITFFVRFLSWNNPMDCLTDSLVSLPILSWPPVASRLCRDQAYFPCKGTACMDTASTGHTLPIVAQNFRKAFHIFPENGYSRNSVPRFLAFRPFALCILSIKNKAHSDNDVPMTEVMNENIGWN